MKRFKAYIVAHYCQCVEVESENKAAAMDKACKSAGEICPELDGECTSFECDRIEEVEDER